MFQGILEAEKECTHPSQQRVADFPKLHHSTKYEKNTTKGEVDRESTYKIKNTSKTKKKKQISKLLIYLDFVNVRIKHNRDKLNMYLSLTWTNGINSHINGTLVWTLF